MNEVKIELVDRRLLKAAPRNANTMTADKFAALCNSMRLRGFLPYFPIVAVRTEDGSLEVTDGHHRLRAAEVVAIEKVPVVYEQLSPQERLTWALAFNGTRGTLDFTEVAAILSDLTREGWTVEELAESAMPESEISALLASLEETPPAPPPLPKPAVPTNERPHVLELRFATRKQLLAVKKKLRKSGGPARDLALGLLSILEVQ